MSENGITGKCLVMVTDDAERTMNTYLGVSDAFSEAEIDQNALINSEWFYIEGYRKQMTSEQKLFIQR